MSIIPFNDAPEVNPGGSNNTPISASAGINTSGWDRFRQGNSVRDMSDFSKMMTFYISDKGLPSNASARFDPSFQKLNFGHEILFETVNEAGTAMAPFDDIPGILNPVQFINDPLSAEYPVVMVSPNWLDPSMMNGVIEPLQIRGSLINASIGGPFIAHDIRAALMPTVGPEIAGQAAIISNFMEFEPRATIAPYFDSQNISLSVTFEGITFNLAEPGYAYPEEMPIKPFNDSVITNPTDFPFLSLSSSFNALGQFIENPGYGIYGKSSTTGFTNREGNYVVNSTRMGSTGSNTGNQFVLGTDSIAFGGWLK